MTSSSEKFTEDYDTLLTEFLVLRRKLNSKVEALLILSRELDQCRSERDQFKLMAEQLRERCSGLKKRIDGKGNFSWNYYDCRSYRGQSEQTLAQLLCELKEQNKSLQFEADDLRQKLGDAKGDIKLLREQIARQRVGTTDEGVSTRHFPAHERENLVKELETVKLKYSLLERDLQSVLDEKEELIMERDAYKHKVERLNHELNYVLKGDEKRIIDVDALVMENRYLQERLKQIQEEKSLYLQTLSKYKNILEKKKNRGVLKLGANGTGGVIITHKQVQKMLQSTSVSQLPTTQATIADLRSLALALFESLNDKNLALSHQKKANKILGNRVAELESKIKTVEIHDMWHYKGHAFTENDILDFARTGCDNKTQDDSSSSEVNVKTSQSINNLKSDCVEVHSNGILNHSEPSKDTNYDSVSSSLSTNSKSSHVNGISKASSDIDVALSRKSSCASGEVVAVPLQLTSEMSTESEPLSIETAESLRSSDSAKPFADSVEIETESIRNEEDVEEEDETDELPPELQKLVQNALDELQKEGSEVEIRSVFCRAGI